VSAVPQLDHFDHDTAWDLGSALVDRCRKDRLPVTIVIWVGEQRVFHAALAGTSADNDRWVERKARIVRHFALSSAEVHAAHAGEDVESFLRVFALPVEQYFPAGGAVPLEIGGTMVGVLAISGLASDEDHDLAVEGLRAFTTTGGEAAADGDVA
jgi:uncharacterized protein (UPF0303 family)